MDGSSPDGEADRFRDKIDDTSSDSLSSSSAFAVGFLSRREERCVGTSVLSATVLVSKLMAGICSGSVAVPSVPFTAEAGGEISVVEALLDRRLALGMVGDSGSGEVLWEFEFDPFTFVTGLVVVSSVESTLVADKASAFAVALRARPDDRVPF